MAKKENEKVTQESFKDVVNDGEKTPKVERVKKDRISDEHLNQLQNLVNGINSMQFNIGKVEAQKHTMLHNLSLARDRVSLFQDTLQKEYGTFDVNLDDGKINWPEEEGKKNEE